MYDKNQIFGLGPKKIPKLVIGPNFRKKQKLVKPKNSLKHDIGKNKKICTEVVPQTREAQLRHISKKSKKNRINLTANMLWL